MIELKKGKRGDLPIILEIANTAFGPEREAGFDFRTVMPKAYGEGRDGSEQHVIVTENGIPVACAGNLPFLFPAGGKNYRASAFGTVSTLPAYRGRGHMTRMLHAMEEESCRRGDVFTVLTGIRARYERFGFEKFPSSYRFLFYRYTADHAPSNDLRIEPATEKDRGALYAIYLKTQPVILREQEDFYIALHTSGAEVFAIRSGERLIAYFSLSARKALVTELAMEDLALLPAVVAAIVRSAGNTVTFLVNALDRPLVQAMDAIAEETQRVDHLHIKIRDMRAFLELLIAINKPHAPEEIWKIGDETFRIAPCGSPTVTLTDAAPMFLCSVRDFIRHALGDGASMEQSEIFPLFFGINAPDMF